MPITVGDKAPDFSLKDQNNQEITLASYQGRKNVLLVFYPFAFSGLCTTELCQVRDELPRYENDNTQVLAISTDPMYALKAWAGQEQYRFPLLSDFWPHGEVAKNYGVFNDKAGMATRGTFLVDREGLVKFAEVNEPGQVRDQGAWLRALSALPV